MFSSDSQVSQNGKTSSKEYHSYPKKAHSHNGLPPHVETPTSAKSLPLNSESVGVTGIETANVKTEEAEIDKAAATARAQSWQIAPNLFTSFRYAWAGISYAFQTQRNFRVHTGVGILAILLCWALKVSNLEVAVVCLTIGAVLVMEIINTALESLVDLTVGQNYHELAKIAKDCAAGAVLMAAIVALAVATLIFAPPLWAILGPSVLSI